MAFNGFVFPDPFALAKAQNGDTTNPPGQKCEVKVYEARFNSKGVRVPLQVGTERGFRAQVDQDHDSALVFTRYYRKDVEFDGTNGLDYTELEIKSQHIKTALREVVKEYPGVDLGANKVVIKDLPKCFLHYCKELHSYGLTLQDPVAVQHLVFALEYMFRVLQDQLISYYNFIESPSLAPGLEFVNLWMVYRPGDIIYVKAKATNASWAGRLKTMDRCTCLKKNCYVSRWLLTLEIIDFDGTGFGRRLSAVIISPYENYTKLEELNAFPLKHLSDSDTEGLMLVARGKKFVNLAGVYYRSYTGDASSPYRNTFEDDDSLQVITATGRIMIDGLGFEKANPNHVKYLSSKLDMVKEEHLSFSDDELSICHHQVRGFAFSQKRWCLFDVANIWEIEYNSDAFEFLLLPEDQKEIIHSLVKIHKDERLVFDDVIKGKGKGMVFLLHGAPGTGKTLTAESVADYTQRPLYAVNCGHFGSRPDAVEKSFSEIIELASSWNAILLIDEADVFLEQRSTQDVVRNALVSVFLRVLEYYEGILFLTTNRVSVFDAAFKSRIYLAIKYTALSALSRRGLWKSFVTRASPNSQLEWIDDAYLEKLSAVHLNGREIKNTVRTAHALAMSAGKPLSAQHIDTALRFMQTFNADLTSEVSEERDDSESSERRRKRRRIE